MLRVTLPVASKGLVTRYLLLVIFKEKVMREAELLGLERLYLLTPNKERFYSRLGWKVLEYTHYRGEDVVIMVYEVGNQQSRRT